jgi:hypothetical protein
MSVGFFVERRLALEHRGRAELSERGKARVDRECPTFPPRWSPLERLLRDAPAYWPLGDDAASVVACREVPTISIPGGRGGSTSCRSSSVGQSPRRSSPMCTTTVESTSSRSSVPRWRSVSRASASSFPRCAPGRRSGGPWGPSPKGHGVCRPTDFGAPPLAAERRQPDVKHSTWVSCVSIAERTAATSRRSIASGILEFELRLHFE